MSSNNNNKIRDFFKSEKFQRFSKSFGYYFDIFFRVVRGLITFSIILVVLMGVLGGGTALGYFASLVEETPTPTQEEMKQQINDYNKKSTFYFADNSRISDVRSDLIRTPISLENISPLIINSLIAVEDENFWDHEGIVPKALARAAIQELSNAAQVSGGSTLTQQLIKQQILSAEVTHDRKATEILYATHLENNFSKEEILEAYMNVSPFGRNNLGQNIAGIEEAALGIFGVPAAEVNLPQATFLAGLPQSPIVYSPYTQYGELKEDLSRGLNRQQEVLYSLFREGYITEEDYDYARNYDITADFLPQSFEDADPAESYEYDIVFRKAQEILVSQLIAADEITQEEFNSEENASLREEYREQAEFELRNGGYNIYSTIDPAVHRAVAESVNSLKGTLGRPQTYTWTDQEGTTHSNEYEVQMSGAIIENTTGRIISFIGGRDYDYSKYNIAFDSRRGTGSAIKPLFTYGPALEEDFITPATIIPDTELIVQNSPGDYHNISNIGRTTNEWGDVRRWLSVSQNIPNTKIYLGMLDNNIDISKYARAMGIGPDAISDHEFHQPSTSLGQTSRGPTPLEVTGAYAVIGNKGMFNEPYLIERIEKTTGEVIYEHELNPVRVWSETTNYLLYDILRDVATNGTASPLPGQLNFQIDLASKTGTTNSTRDVWYAGVTPKISMTTWMGYDDQNLNLLIENGVWPYQRNLRNWATIMNAVHRVRPDLVGAGQQFPLPADNSIVRDTVLANTGMKGGTVELPNGETITITGETKSELFARDNIPGTTTYDFAVGASSEELATWWSRITTSEPGPEEDEEKDDSEDTDEDTDADTDEDTSDGGNDSSEDNTEETPPADENEE